MGYEWQFDIDEGVIMTKLKDITRREFISGIAVTGVMAGLMSSTSSLAASDGQVFSARSNFIYPPLRTGMRGSHKGSFEVAHTLAIAGERPASPDNYTDTDYDLVIVGGGISGLSAGWLARKKLGPHASILILDNHDDFGGHAKRNEFEVSGKKLVGYGGSQSIDSPASYSDEAKAIMRGIGIDTKKFYQYFDRSFYKNHGMAQGIHFSKGQYGKDHLSLLTTSGGLLWQGEVEKVALSATIDGWPVSAESRAALKRLLIDRFDWCEAWMPRASKAEKIEALKTISYKDALMQHAGLNEEAYSIIAGDYVGMWALEWDALSALEAVRAYHGGAMHLGIDPHEIITTGHDEEPYIFHFPDGNAGVARLLVKGLVPGSVEAPTMEDMVTAHFEYDRLDLDKNATRIRLNATVIEAKNIDDHVDVTYVRGGKAEKVKAKAVIMAGYAHMLPHILPEMGKKQKEAIDWAEKVPMAYVNVALTNWRAWQKAGVRYFTCPKGFYSNLSLDFPVSIGGVKFSPTSDDPIVAHLTYYPMKPGVPSRQQHREGRHKMLELTFDDFETAVIKELSAALGPYGFDAESDIAAITVNRWPHGYAYEYNELFDPHDWTPEKGPHIEGSKRIGNIAMAGSDASAFAYVNGAMDAAVRAVAELFEEH